MLHRFLRPALALTVATATLTAATLPAAAPAAAAVLPAAFQGTATDAATGDPAADVCVTVWRVEGNVSTPQSPRPCTGADGRWSVTGLAPGTYTVQAAGRYWAEQWAYGWDTLRDADRFSVSGGQLTVVDLAMRAAGEVTGTVTDAATGLPLAGVCASVAVPGRSRRGCTDASGAYVVHGVRPGTYPLTVADDSGAYGAYDTYVTVAAAQTTAADAALARTGAVSGTVTDAATGDPVEGVCVTATPDPAADYGPTACTDAIGQYLLESVPAGATHLAAVDATGAHPRTFLPGTTDPGASATVTVTSAATTTGADLALGAAAYVAGTVTDEAGAPLAACATATRTDGTGILGAGGPLACTDDDGRYVVGGLPSGTFSVRFSAYDPGKLPSTVVGVTVAEGQTTDLDATLAEGARIRGRVVDALTKQPVAGVCATHTLYSGRGGLDLGVEPVCTDPDGRYELAGLPGGSYHVEFYDPAGGYAWQFYPGQARRADATALTVAPGTVTSGVDAELLPGGTVEGVVHDTAGRPAKHVCAEAFQGPAQDPVGTVRCTGADGRFTLRGLPTTTVKVRFSGWAYVTEWAVDQPTYAAATPLPTLAGGATPVAAVVARTP